MPSHRPTSLASAELLELDFRALVAHMSSCARSRERFFTLRSQVQQARKFAADRLITLSCVILALAVGCVVMT